MGTVLQLDHINRKPALHRLVRRIDDPYLAATTCFIIAFIAAPRRHRWHPGASSRLSDVTATTSSLVQLFSSNAIGLHFIQFGKPHH